MLRDDSGLFVDPTDDYVQAETSKTLLVPEDMADSVGDTWPIPDIVELPTAKTYAKEVPRPKFFAGRNLDEIKIQKLGEKSWIVLADAPELVWPLVKQFLADSGVAIEREDAPAGIVESDWFGVDAATNDTLRTAVREGLAQSEQGSATEGSWLDRVQVRIERGIRLGSTEVHVVHSRRSAATDAAAVPEVEVELIKELADYIAQGVAVASVSMVGREIASVSKARIVEDDGVPTLVLNLEFDRAWATVDQALERAELEVTHSDRDRGSFRAVIHAVDERGFLARILPGGADAGSAQAVTIHLRTVDDGVVIEVQDDAGQPVARELAEEVLLTLREFAA